MKEEENKRAHVQNQYALGLLRGANLNPCTSSVGEVLVHDEAF